MTIASDKQSQLHFLIHCGNDDTEGVTDLARFLLSNIGDDDLQLTQKDSHGLNAFHYACKLGKPKMFQLLFSCLNLEEKKRCLNMQADLPVEFVHILYLLSCYKF